MKKYTLILALLTLCFSCQNEPKEDNSNASTSTTTAAPADNNNNSNAASATKEEGSHITASALSPYIGFWEYAATVVIRDPEAYGKIKGSWIELKNDGTYERGRWQEKTGDGEWKFDEATTNITLYPHDPAQAGEEWKTKANGDIMIWVGTKRYQKTGTQIKLSRITERPKKS